MEKSDFTVDFIGIGSGKSASTWIFQCLLDHPEVSGPQQKELKFFDSVHQWKKGKDYYLSLFPKSDISTKRGEFSPGYLPSLDAAKRIYEWFPDTKLIVTLRNPIEKMYSTYWSNKIGGRGSLAIFETFEEAYTKVPEIIENARYGKHLERYLAIFPKEQIHIVFYDDILQDPKKVIQGIYTFLEVESSFVPKSLYRGVNETGTKQIKYKRIIKLIYSIYWNVKRKNWWKFIQKHIDTRRIAVWLQKFGIKNGGEKIQKPIIDNNVVLYLKKLFKSDIELLETITGRDMSHWK